MKKTIGITLFALLAFATLTATTLAAPINPEPVFFTQPNGERIQVTTYGDEFLSWTENENGFLIVFCEDTNGYYYAVWTDNGPESTGELVGGVVPFGPQPLRVKGADIPQAVLETAGQIRDERMAFLSELDFTPPISTTTRSSSEPVVNSVENLQRRVLIIHVRWEDESYMDEFDLKPMNGKQLYDHVFEPDTSSVNNYYKELFGIGEEDIILPAILDNPKDGYQGIVEVTLSGPFIGGAPGYSPVFERAFNAADEFVDFSQYDTNGDGILQVPELSIGVLVYGIGSWSAAGGAGGDIRDGVSFAGTTCFMTNVFSIYGQLTTIGTTCHEMGHSAFGFRDTYDYGEEIADGKSMGHGRWSLMSSGQGYVDAYNLVEYNIVMPGVISEYNGGVRLNSHLDIYKVISGVDSKQYFLLQQRKYGSTDNYDRATFSAIASTSGPSTGGLLIYHIDENVNIYRINDKNTHYRAKIEEAHGGIFHLQQVSGMGNNNGDLGDLWGVGKSVFCDMSDPTSRLYSKFTNDTEPPSQHIPSEVVIYNIKWDSVFGATTLSVSYYKEDSGNGNDFTITATARENGNATGGGVFDELDTVILVAIPDHGCVFEGWYVNGNRIDGAGAIYCFIAKTDGEFEARFVKSLYWIECYADSFAGGDGSQSNPYLIATAEQLAKLARDISLNWMIYQNVNFELISNIDLSGRYWEPIGNSSLNRFRGNFDGNYFTVKNLTMSSAQDDSTTFGLFGAIANGTIKNLAILDADIPTGEGGGILATAAGDSTIENCYTTGSIPKGSGFIGSVSSTNISNCYSTASASRAGLVNSLVGNSLVHNSYAAGEMINDPEYIGYIGGLISNIQNGPSLINSFAANLVPNRASYGGFVGYKWNSRIQKSYYLSSNPRGIGYDADPAISDLTAKAMDFFKDKGSFTNLSNWSSQYPWDFSDIWVIDADVNNGLPYLRGFTKNTDKSALIAAIARFGNLDESGYTASSWAVAATAYNAAKSVLSNEGVRQEEIDAATNALNKAIDTLEPSIATLRITAANVTARPGSLVTIPVTIHNNPGVKGLSLTLDYDNTMLEFVSLDTAPLDVLGEAVWSSLSGRVSLAWISGGSSALLETDGELISATFRVKSNALIGVSPLMLNGRVGSLTGDIDAVFVDGAVDVIAYKLGDVNNDGVVDLLDAIIVQSIWLDMLVFSLEGERIAPTPAQLLAADINRDGRVDANDLVLILRYLAGDPGIIL